MKHTLGFLVGATSLFQIAVALPPPVKEETPTPSAIAENACSPPGKSAFKGQRHVNGTITDRDLSTVNALDRPLGRYEKLIRDAIGAAWYRYVAERSEFLSLGTIRISFFVDPTGRIKELKVIQNSSNEAFANVCLQSILEINE